MGLKYGAKTLVRVTVGNKDVPAELHRTPMQQSCARRRIFGLALDASLSMARTYRVSLRVQWTSRPPGQKSWAMLMKECEEEKGSRNTK
jgi:hypothetical protein